MAVIGVLAEADVGDDERDGRRALDRAHGGLHRRFRIVGERSDVVFGIGQAEQDDALHAVAAGRFHFLYGFVDREVVDARHRRHFATDTLASTDEQRQDEHVRGQTRLADEIAHRRGLPQAAETPGQFQRHVGVDVSHLSALTE